MIVSIALALAMMQSEAEGVGFALVVENHPRVDSFLESIGAEVAEARSPEPSLAELVRQEAEPIASTTVGMRVRIDELPIPGPQLRAKPVSDAGKADVIIRVINVFPHGDAWRYNLEVTPFVEGRIDLREHMETLDEGPVTSGRPLVVEVGAVLPAGVIEPNDLEVPEPKDVGGYRSRMVFFGVLWGLVLLALIFVGRKKKEADGDAADAPPPTLADRLKPLVEEAQSGDLSTGRRAELERLLLAHWRERRDLSGVHVAEAVSRLRNDDEAGPLFLQLEVWLHSPNGQGETKVDVAALLEPYRNAPDPALVTGGSAR